MIVSIPHPSRITNEDISETVNKILGKVDFVLKEEIPEKKDSLLSETNRGPEMSFTEADSGHVNPNLEECDGFQ